MGLFTARTTPNGYDSSLVLERATELADAQGMFADEDVLDDYRTALIDALVTVFGSGPDAGDWAVMEVSLAQSQGRTVEEWAYLIGQGKFMDPAHTSGEKFMEELESEVKRLFGSVNDLGSSEDESS